VEIQQAIRFNLFHILQASARAEDAGVPAKGLTGQAYEGHYFWDTEIYVLPFLTYTSPRIAKNLLTFRYKMLPQARARARQLGHRGAMFPWRTISGEEASAYYAAGTAQYHINADIMYALRKYVQATGDEAFLRECGAEMLVETARLWLEHGFYSDAKDGKFCINSVTGPDEYNTVVNNNAYTNLMARENLRYAAQTVQSLRATNQAAYDALALKTALEPSEVDAWVRAAENMYVPYDESCRSSRRMTASLTESLGISETHRPTTTLCCCFTTRSTSTGNKLSNRRTWSWPCSCWAIRFRWSPRNEILNSTIR
jgi:alpha,alpha-trehalose phosphorylase